jgi:hypothetical protein
VHWQVACLLQEAGIGVCFCHQQYGVNGLVPALILSWFPLVQSFWSRLAGKFGNKFFW